MYVLCVCLCAGVGVVCFFAFDVFDVVVVFVLFFCAELILLFGILCLFFVRVCSIVACLCYCVVACVVFELVYYNVFICVMMFSPLPGRAPFVMLFCCF